jgi:hypothetical protein
VTIFDLPGDRILTMSEVCSKCSNDCIRAEPVTVHGEPIINIKDVILCYRYTCIFGMLAAKRALILGVTNRLTLYDGSIVEAVPFGTEDKPTADPGEFERYVTLDGAIVANNADGEYFYTGQNVFKGRI